MSHFPWIISIFILTSFFSERSFNLIFKTLFLAQSILRRKIVVYILGKWKNSTDENAWTVGRRDSSLPFDNGKSKLRRKYDRSYFGKFTKFFSSKFNSNAGGVRFATLPISLCETMKFMAWTLNFIEKRFTNEISGINFFFLFTHFWKKFLYWDKLMNRYSRISI